MPVRAAYERKQYIRRAVLLLGFVGTSCLTKVSSVCQSTCKTLLSGIVELRAARWLWLVGRAQRVTVWEPLCYKPKRRNEKNLRKQALQGRQQLVRCVLRLAGTVG